MFTDGIITLRAPEPSDLDAMYRWENDAQFWEGGDTCAPLSRHLLETFISNYDGNIAATHQLRLVITTSGNGNVVGTIDLFEYSPIHLRAGIGIIIDGNFRRRGLGLRALRLTASYCRTHLGLHQLWCHIAADNIASRQLFEKAGFTPSGQLRSWLRRGNNFADVHIYQLSL